MIEKKENIILLQLILKRFQQNNDFEKSFNLAANELNLSKTKKEKILKEYFNNRVSSLVEQINNFINQKMKKELTKKFSDLRTNQKIKYLVINRLKIINKYFDKKTLLKLVLNQNSPLRLNKMLFGISDEIWFLAGDKTTDFNYYSKRIILANIYIASFIYSLNDKSEGYKKTNDFVDYQISLAGKIGKYKSKIKSFFNQK